MPRAVYDGIAAVVLGLSPSLLIIRLTGFYVFEIKGRKLHEGIYSSRSIGGPKKKKKNKKKIGPLISCGY
jgi:hypothetical protein